jgi:hypothetical protein
MMNDKKRVKKRHLISAIVGAVIAIFTFICCGLLIPLGFIGAAIFFHQYRIPIIILGSGIGIVSIFFFLRGGGKGCICELICKLKDRISKELIVGLVCILCVSSAVWFFWTDFSKSSLITGQSVSEWKSDKVNPDLVNVVNFLENNKGREIELYGKKGVITGEEKLDVTIKMLECCTKEEFDDLLGSLSTIGEVSSSNYEQKLIQASLPANKISALADIWNLERMSFEAKARAFWIKIIS